MRLRRSGAVALYLLLLVAAAWVVVGAALDVTSASGELTEARERLAAIESRAHQQPAFRGSIGELPPGSAFLAGEKLSIAAADFQKRGADAVAAVSGLVLSSQVERGETKGGATGLELQIECELPQSGLQSLLYGLEASAPLLFIESVDLRSKLDASEAGDPRIRATLRLSATWREVGP
jgi:hypothetical protein